MTDAAASPLCAALLAHKQICSIDLSMCQLGNITGQKLLKVAQIMVQSRNAGSAKHKLQVCHTSDLLDTTNASRHVQF